MPSSTYTSFSSVGSALTTCILVFLASCPLQASAGFNPNPMGLPTNPDESSLHTCEASSADSPRLDQMRKVSSYMRNNKAWTPVKPLHDKACTFVLDQDDAAVYICTNGIKGSADNCGPVNGTNVANALDDMFNDPNCVTNANNVDYTGGVAWVNGPMVGPATLDECVATDAAFITMRKSGPARPKSLGDVMDGSVGS